MGELNHAGWIEDHATDAARGFEEDTMTLKEWFKEPDTPSENSPVGQMMVKVLEKYPNMTFEEARAEANSLLDQAAGRKNYRVPRVYTPEKKAARLSNFKERVRDRQ